MCFFPADTGIKLAMDYKMKGISLGFKILCENEASQRFHIKNFSVKKKKECGTECKHDNSQSYDLLI